MPLRENADTPVVGVELNFAFNLSRSSMLRISTLLIKAALEKIPLEADFAITFSADVGFVGNYKEIESSKIR